MAEDPWGPKPNDYRLSRMELKESWITSIAEAVTKRITKTEIRAGKNKLPTFPMMWGDTDTTNMAWAMETEPGQILQDIEDAIHVMKQYYDINIAIRIPKEMYDKMMADKEKIKSFGFEVVEDTGPPIDRDCFYCGGVVSFNEWVRHFREKGGKGADARRAWNNELVIIACCHCIATVSQEEFLQKMYIMFGGHVRDDEDS